VSKAIIVAVAMLAASSFSSLAQSTQDLSIARRSAAIFDIAYRKTGMSGINTRVQECYAKAKARKSEALVEQCFILDFLGSEMDAAFFKMMHRSQSDDSQNTIVAVNSRANRILDLFGLDTTQRGRKISEWAKAGLIALNELASR
jgi:anti-anti-sigma regulatory factor